MPHFASGRKNCLLDEVTETALLSRGSHVAVAPPRVIPDICIIEPASHNSTIFHEYPSVLGVSGLDPVGWNCSNCMAVRGWAWRSIALFTESKRTHKPHFKAQILRSGAKVPNLEVRGVFGGADCN
jgi:hypothetical protein